MATKKKALKRTTVKSTGKKTAPKKAGAKKPTANKKSAVKSKTTSKTGAKKATPKKPTKVLKSKAVAKNKGKVTSKKELPKKQILKKSISNKILSKKPTVKPIAKKIIEKPVIKSTVIPVSAKTNYTLPSKKIDTKPVRKTPIVIPKISVSTSVKYNPDFTKSVLDSTFQNQTEPMARYSDAELAEFKDLISKKLDAARKELSYLQGLITRKDEMGGDETENRYMTMEDGSVSMEREQLSQMASRQIQFIDHLEKALARIENKTYGICRITGKLIDKARLRAVPHATLSMEAKMGGMK